MIVVFYNRKSSAVSAMTSSVVMEMTSGDGVTSSDNTSGRGSDMDEVIFVEGPREEGKERVELPAIELYSPASDMASTSASRQLQVASATINHQPWMRWRTSQHRFSDRTSSSQPAWTTTAVLSDYEPAQVKSEERDDQHSTPRYLALAVNVALLAGIIFVVAVFLAVLVSFILHRRRQRQQDLTSTTSNTATVVSRPTIKPAYEGFSATSKHTAICLPPPPHNKPRLFVSVSKVGDPKEWFV